MAKIERIKRIYGTYEALLIDVYLMIVEDKRRAAVDPIALSLFLEDLDSLWALLPPRVQAQAKAMLKVTSIKEIEEIALRECGAEGDEFEHPVKLQQRCHARLYEYLSKAFHVITSLVHKTGLFYYMRDIERGGEYEENIEHGG
ncbi:MAG TPA: hypothetical protein EYP33_02550 [Pyrodictium sp.]|nr:hypothetical protein [Pyrodictium sp.]